jgi:hypothetical protein
MLIHNNTRLDVNCTAVGNIGTVMLQKLLSIIKSWENGKRCVQTKYQQWRERRFLKAHGCDNWTQYNRLYDHRYNRRGNTLAEYYFGYQKYIVLDNPNHYAYTCLWDHGPGGYRDGIHDIMDWCAEHCEHAWRVDMLRMYYDSGWCMNEIGGGDYICFAFETQQDLAWFKLRWM